MRTGLRALASPRALPSCSLWSAARIALLLALQCAATSGCGADAASTVLDPSESPAAPQVEQVEQDEGAGACVDGACPSTPPQAGAWNLCEALSKRAGSPLPSSERVSWAELLCELADLDRFTRAPARYALKMASSRDPKSQSEGGEGWFANDDFAHYLRSDRNEHVMMESRGAGVITRFWSANPSGILRVYIDDETKPVIDVDMSLLFAGLLGDPWTAPFVFQSAGGSNLIFPIPYARYARVTTTAPSAKFFYQVNYREYDGDVEVEPYSPAGQRRLTPLAREVRNWLRNPSDHRGLPTLDDTRMRLSDAAPKARVSLGPAVVRELSLRGFQLTDAWMRKTRIILTVDGERTVDAPIGSLFTADLAPSQHASIVASVRSDALVLRWPMPVRGELGVELESNGGRIGQLELQLRSSRGVPDDARMFHAQWSGPRTFNTTDPIDWKLVDFRGEGWYVGTVLNIANPALEWWGEGDEKIFVDGEAVPSLFGTGTEDYFGFGWCSNEAFALPWNGQTRVLGALNRGRASMYRWHILDAIPFRSELRFNLEVLHWRSGAQPVAFTQDALAVWYATPGGSVRSRGVDLSDFQVPLVNSSGALWPYPYDCRILGLLP